MGLHRIAGRIVTRRTEISVSIMLLWFGISRRSPHGDALNLPHDFYVSNDFIASSKAVTMLLVSGSVSMQSETFLQACEIVL